MGIYLWIFDWGVGYVALTMAAMIVSQALSRYNPRQGQMFEYMVILVLLAMHFWAYQSLQTHKNAYDTGERWAQYGAL